MKKHIIICLLFLGIFELVSCSKEPEDNHPYYKFNDSDLNLIINYNYIENQIITYENQFGEKLHFKVMSNIFKKESKYSGSGFVGSYSSLDYYYDSKIVRLEIVENESNYRYNQVIYNFSKSQNIFKNTLNNPIWNTESSSTFYDDVDRPFNIELNIYNSNNKIQLNINGHTFNKIVEINSNNNTTTFPPIYGALLTKNVNKVLYDYDFGIVEFEDIDGKVWKVIYP
jgi:hypothetical protein